ncbi:MAG TPA: ABC-2 family transporter protein, partial [Desulfomonilia bacterium]|nr:ABC-2 family transporter protein [Desulfomonilia bacterium]
MKALLGIYLQQFRTTIVMMLQYRAMLAIWMIGHVLEPLIYLIVWSIVSNTQGGSVGDFTAQKFAAYFIVLMLVNHTTYTWIMYEYEYRIREGVLSFALLKPVHPIHSDIADNISAKLVTLPIMLSVAACMVVVFKPSATFVPWAVFAFIPALILAFLLRFLLEWTLAQTAFW